MARLEPILIPRHLQIDAAELDSAINRAVDAEAEEIRKDYKKASADFSEPPTFYIQKQGKHGRLIGTRDEAFNYTTEGTEGPYPIVAHGRTLAFRANYQRKTLVGQIATRSGGASGPMVYRQRVMHPGIEGTHVNKKIAEAHEEPFRRRLEKEIKGVLPTK